MLNRVEACRRLARSWPGPGVHSCAGEVSFDAGASPAKDSSRQPWGIHGRGHGTKPLSRQRFVAGLVSTRDSRSANVVERGNPPRSSTGAEPWNSGLRPSPRYANACSRTCALRKFQPHTQTGYVRAVLRLTHFLERFQVHLADDGATPSTINAT